MFYFFFSNLEGTPNSALVLTVLRGNDSDLFSVRGLLRRPRERETQEEYVETTPAGF